MTENSENGQSLPDTLSGSPLGSPESRAAARLLVNDPSRPPSLLVLFVEPPPRDDKGRPLGPPVRCAVHHADVNGKRLVRGKTESLEHFEARVVGELPAGRPGLAVLFPEDA